MSNSLPLISGFSSYIAIDVNDIHRKPQLIDSDVTFFDGNNSFDGGTLVLSGLLADDIISIRNQGTGGGQIGFSGGIITFADTIIGTATGGTGTTLSITFNAYANSAAIEAMIENFTFSSLSGTPTAARALELTITDATGAKVGAGLTLTEQTGVANPFYGIDVGFNSRASFGDIDGDGDLDLVIGEQDGNLNYYENTGTRLAPAYTVRTSSANPFDGIDVGFRSMPDLVDIDGDGDLDLVIGESSGTQKYYENTGTRLAPTYIERTGSDNPFNGISAWFSNATSFGDIDGDGDFDLIIGEEDGTFEYHENTGTARAPVYTERTGWENPFDGIDIGAYNSPGFADLDGDGDLDLVIGELDGTLNYYENTGTGIAPSYTERTGATNPFNGIDIGIASTPDFADVDGDGDLDLIIGELDGTLNYYTNTSIKQAPAFAERVGVNNPFNDIGIFAVVQPNFVDIDGDGDLDLVSGTGSGGMRYHENTGTAVSPTFTLRSGDDSPFDVSTYISRYSRLSWSAPSLADYDGDGDFDLITGGLNGRFHLYENIGSSVAPIFGVREYWFDLSVGWNSAPTFADIDGDGDLDLVSGSADGSLVYYKNFGTGLEPVFVDISYENPFDGIDVGYSSAPTFADIDGDGDLDLVVGASYGNSLSYYENTGSGLTPTFTERTGSANPFNGIGIGNYDTPTFADIDGDGDLDLVIGEWDGDLTVHYYENIGGGFRTTLNVTPYEDPSENADVITGTIGNDAIFALGGDDTIHGLSGNDTIVGGAGNDTMIGSTGDDSYFVQDAGDIITENVDGGSDVAYIIDVNSYTLFANVEIGVALGASLNIGGNGIANTLIGNALDNVLSGAAGGDVLYGVAGANSMFGGAGNDVLVSGIGADGMAGGMGNDTYIIGAGDIVTETYIGGYDTVWSSLASYTLTAAIEVGILMGGTALTGNISRNTLIGDGSANTLSGEDNNDSLLGGGGGDTLIGGTGQDTMQGNGGSDIFVWRSQSELGDYILDWVNTEDQLQFTAGGFFQFVGGSLVEGLNFITGANPGATTANATFLWDSDDTNLFFDADGNGAGAAVVVAVFQEFTTLDVSDFQFV